jgi:hypothetical protein
VSARARDDVWARRWWALGIAATLSIALPLVIGHRGTHMALNLLLPGAGLFGVDVLGAVALVIAAVVAFGLWLRWGIDWSVLVVLAVAMIFSGLAVHDHATAKAAGSITVERSSHEFPLVLLLVSLLSRVERFVRRFPPIAAIHRHRAAKRDGWHAVGALGPRDRCRTATIAALAGPVDAACITAVQDPDIRRRARRIGVAARGRFGGDPLRVDHVHARTALAVTGQLDAAAVQQLLDDAGATAVGLPCSEPGWVRLIDAALTAAAFQRIGRERAARDLKRLLADELRLKRGHRPEAWWTILGLRTGPAATWEHATATSVARALGAVDDSDWHALRTRAFGAAARGTADPYDERIIAAARIWLVFVDDAAARPIIDRPSVRHDPMAVALDRLATALRTEPDRLRRPAPAAA